MARAKYFTIISSAIFFGMVWIWAAWSPVNRFMWFLENILTIVFFVVFIYIHRLYRFSILSYLTITIFLTLHTIGSHYSYQTPIDPWLSQWFALDRAYYDRVVHFSFGLLMIFPVKDWLAQLLSSLTKLWLYFFSILSIFAAGAFYELIEMWVTLIVAPEQGTAFIGTQGDVWDTQHDMELALYGSILALCIYTCIHWIIRMLNKKLVNR